MSSFSSHSFRARYGQGEDVASLGEPSEKVGVLAEGLVKISVITEQGDEILLQVLRPGQLVGDPVEDTNRFSWAAAADAEICWMTRKTWDRFLQERPQHFRAYLATTQTQLEEFQLWVVKMRGRKAVQRVAFWLLEQVPTATDPDRYEIQIRLTRRDLASLLDMTVETLCRSLQFLVHRNAIRMQGSERAQVTDLTKLRLLARYTEEFVSHAATEPAVVGASDVWHDWFGQRRAEEQSSPAQLRLVGQRRVS